MKTKNRNILAGAAVAVLLGGAFGGIATLGNHKAVAEGQGSALDLLNGFTCPGASVYISGAGESIAKQMRFVLNLDAAQAAYADEAHTAGVVVLPYDLYRKYNLSELTKDSEIASKVDVKWEKQENGSYTSYAYLDATLIPAGQENRTLVARGYIEDGTNVYYTEEVKASMAYVAWKNIGMQGGAYDTQLKEYMGEYTLTYGAGENEKIGGLYYGDTFYTQLPEKVGGYNVDKWYWDEEKTQKIEAADYATGSMTIYYELEKFDVTGTISCAEGIDLTKVKVYVNGEDTGATVSESGSFSVQLPAGKHDFVFETEGYIAYADGVEVSATTEAINATLKKNTYAIGDYKSEKVNSEVTYDKNAALDGSVTVSGTVSAYSLPLPNAATADEAEYNFSMKNFPWVGSDYNGFYGLALTNGNVSVSFSFSRWENLRVRIGDKEVGYAGYNETNYGYFGGSQRGYKIIRTSNALYLYVNKIIALTINADGITLPSACKVSWGGDNATAMKDLIMQNFIGENKEIAPMLFYVAQNVSDQSVRSITYTYSMAKLYAVSGTISAADGVDLTATSLTVDGISTPISVQENGSYSVLIAEGKHTLVFANGKYGATKEITVVNGENIADVQLKDGTWLAGKYGNVASNNTPELNENGTYTVSGKDQMIIFPNTATSNSFTYEVTVNDINRSDRDSKIGICITDGNYRLAIGLSEDWQVLVSLSQDSGEATHNYYGLGGKPGVNGVKLKFVVTKQDIKFYVNNTLRFTFTSEEITSTISALTDSWVKDTLTDAYKNGIAGFFAENAKIALGIMSGWKDSVTATYTCSITNN